MRKKSVGLAGTKSTDLLTEERRHIQNLFKQFDNTCCEQKKQKIAEAAFLKMRGQIARFLTGETEPRFLNTYANLFLGKA